ncbi:hypothetical protein TWF694_002548 [Orbilia ellipsospora]|uniref:Acyltransferase 3 domain-containing protein n=1 Tax=Orbilia ellipsospora TaxID=2528407 RepID=A0AAV9X2A9_9PEZI
MVEVFFVISGFALSYKVANLSRKPVSYADSHAILRNLASSIWKRYLRLVLPCAGTFILVTLFVGAGWFEAVPFEQRGGLRGLVEPRPPKMDSFFGQLEWGLKDFYKFAVPLTLFFDVGYAVYRWETDSHLWTIPQEFHQSLCLFLTIVGLSHIKRWLRMRVFLPCIVVIALYNMYWEYSLFIFGFLLAEVYVSILSTSENSTSSGVSDTASLPIYSKERRYSYASEILKKTGLVVLFILSLYLCSYPEVSPQPDSTTGFTFLEALTPPRYTEDTWHRFWLTLGAYLLVFSIMMLPKIHTILCSKLFQYLGRISFSLYLVHGTIVRSLGYALVHWGWRQMGVSALWENDSLPDNVKDLEARRIVMVFLGFVGIIPVTIWSADIFWRVVDMPSVRFVRWLESKLVRL